jgi:hypothetical protein
MLHRRRAVVNIMAQHLHFGDGVVLRLSQRSFLSYLPGTRLPRQARDLISASAIMAAVEFVFFTMLSVRALRFGWGSGFQTVDCVNGGCVSLHQMSDRTVYHSLTLKHVLAGERRRRHVNTEVSAAAAHLSL